MIDGVTTVNVTYFMFYRHVKDVIIYNTDTSHPDHIRYSRNVFQKKRDGPKSLTWVLMQ